MEFRVSAHFDDGLEIRQGRRTTSYTIEDINAGISDRVVRDFDPVRSGAT